MPPSIPLRGCSLTNTLKAASSSSSYPQARLLSATASRLTTGYYKQGKPQRFEGAPAIPIPKPSQKTPHIPDYPYGERLVYKQSNGGLYGSARIRFGNNVSERNEIKTRRKWRPNVHRKRLWSASLQCFVQTRVTTRVMRTIDKVGGLDAYLLGDKAARVKELGPWGWKLRWRVMQTPAVRERFAGERAALGLAPAAVAVEETTTTTMGEVPVEFAGAGVTPESLMEETQGMLEREEEFELGGGEETGEFMKEAPRPRA